MNKKIYNTYISILRTELVPALGCTEPIAIAFTAAKVREILGTMPESIEVGCSGNIIKNVHGVTVPNSGGLKGIEIAAVLGVVGGDADKGLEVLADITAEQIEEARKLVEKKFCTCELVEEKDNLFIRITAFTKKSSARVVVSEKHTNVIFIEKDGKILFNKENNFVQSNGDDKQLLNISDIIVFAKQVKLDDVSTAIERQIIYNSAISDEGLMHLYGAQIGRRLRRFYDSNDVRIRARSAAAAGSDARMGGCAMPVVINGGSGNQGMTVSLPVIEYAKELNSSREELIRALVLANLITLLQKRYIGSLSAFCGVVCAAAGAGCGIAFLYGADEDGIIRTLTNTLANIGGIVCDGAKASCAAKIASAVDAAIMGFEMGVRDKLSFKGGEGLVKNSGEQTIRSFGRLGCIGMRATDIEILNIMLEKNKY